MPNKLSNWLKARKNAKKPVSPELIDAPKTPSIDPEYLVAKPDTKVEAVKTKTRNVKLATQKRYFTATSNTNPLAGTQLEIIDNNKSSEPPLAAPIPPKKRPKKHQN